MKQLIVKEYQLQTATGKHVRMATMVILPNGEEIKFMERMTNKEAIRNAEYQLSLRK